MVLIPPHVVRPYVRGNKTDRTDTKGLLELQQALAGLHRLRSTWLATRTARRNAVRGLLREFGVVIPVGARQVVPHVRYMLEDADAGRRNR